MKFTPVSLSLAATASLLALAACATPAADAPIAPVAAAQPAPPPAPARPAPQLGSFGFDAAGMDTSVAPGNDFYAFANGTWARNTAIPADKSNYGMFTALGDLSLDPHPHHPR